MAQPRCPYCGRWFKPKLRKGPRQVTCGSGGCRGEHKRVLGQRWRVNNPERTLDRQEKVRGWAQGRDYWRGWRDERPGYVERNRKQTRERMSRLREERRKARAMLADPVGYLRRLKARCGEGVCKTGTGGAKKRLKIWRNWRTVEGVCKTGTGQEAVVEVVDYLLARECLQNRRGSTPAAGRRDNGGDAGRGTEPVGAGLKVRAAKRAAACGGAPAIGFVGGDGPAKPGDRGGKS